MLVFVVAVAHEEASKKSRKKICQTIKKCFRLDNRFCSVCCTGSRTRRSRDCSVAHTKADESSFRPLWSSIWKKFHLAPLSSSFFRCHHFLISSLTLLLFPREDGQFALKFNIIFIILPLPQSLENRNLISYKVSIRWAVPGELWRFSLCPRIYISLLPSSHIAWLLLINVKWLPTVNIHNTETTVIERQSRCKDDDLEIVQWTPAWIAYLSISNWVSHSCTHAARISESGGYEHDGTSECESNIKNERADNR